MLSIVIVWVVALGIYYLGKRIRARRDACLPSCDLCDSKAVYIVYEQPVMFWAHAEHLPFPPDDDPDFVEWERQFDA